MYTRITRHTGEPDRRLALIATPIGLLAAVALAGPPMPATSG